MEEVDTPIKSETKMIVKEENDDRDGEYNENDDRDGAYNENDDRDGAYNENDDSDDECNEKDDSDGECNENDDSDEELNEYELLRKINEMANIQFVNDLKVLSEIDRLLPKTPEVFKKKRHIAKKRKFLVGSQQPARKSLRLTGKGSSNLSEIKVEPAEELHEPALRRFYTGLICGLMTKEKRHV